MKIKTKVQLGLRRRIHVIQPPGLGADSSITRAISPALFFLRARNKVIDCRNIFSWTGGKALVRSRRIVESILMKSGEDLPGYVTCTKDQSMTARSVHGCVIEAAPDACVCVCVHVNLPVPWHYPGTG